jgi:hypothetical protein
MYLYKQNTIKKMASFVVTDDFADAVFSFFAVFGGEFGGIIDLYILKL